MQQYDEDVTAFLQAFQRGEEKGFDYFFNTLYSPLLYFSFRVVQDKETAKDIVNESFIKIWHRHDNFSHERVIKSWLYTTVRNASIDWLKDQKADRKALDILATYEKGSCDNPFVNEMIYAEVMYTIYQVINDLPEKCRGVIVKLFVDGRTLREVAKEMEISINTVKNQRARGLKLIRKQLADRKEINQININ